MKKNAKGFTLVELAIVLMIIGLLIGGILKGQELITNARIVSTASQVNGYRAAVLTFQDSYGEYPGDMVSPGTRLPNCTVAPCSNAGDGNGILDTAIGGPGAEVFNWNGAEKRKFWLHLAVANLITGIDTSVTTYAPSGFGVFGVQNPTAKIGGGFLPGYYRVNPGDPNFPPYNGHFLTLQTRPGPYTLSPGVMTPSQAAQLDRKMDDGKPATGDMIGIGSDTCYSSTTAVYNESVSDKNCNALIRI